MAAKNVPGPLGKDAEEHITHNHLQSSSVNAFQAIKDTPFNHEGK